MKNIFILILICVIKLSAYNYNIAFANTTTSTIFSFNNEYEDKNVKLYDYDNGTSVYNYYSKSVIFIWLNAIRRSGETSTPELINNPVTPDSNRYIGRKYFNEYYRNDLIFLNDLYTKNSYIDPFLNYLYNPDSFSNDNYIQYENYQILYNSDGLAVESIVNGVWAGLYSDEEKDISGKLYSVDGQLIYNNGEEVHWFGALFDKLTGGFGASFTGCFNVLGNVLISVLIVYFVWNMFYFILRIGKSAINKKESV